MKTKMGISIALFWCICLLFLITSCKHTEDYILENHKSIVVKIDPSHQTKPLSLEQYSVDSVCSISIPDSGKILEINKFMVKDNRIYIMDSRIARTVFVFDSGGKYLFKLGERGRAKHEYIGGPTDFFVDNMNNIHVFDKIGQKIVSFNKKGSVFRVVVTRGDFPHSFGLTNNNRYAYCMNNKSEDRSKPALMFCNWNKENPRKVLAINDRYSYLPSDRTFFSNGATLSHIPILSDSVLVFKNDSLEKVVHFDFGGNFLLKERPDIVSSVDNVKELMNYKGVWALYQYQETNDLVFLEYLHNIYVRYWLYNKHTQKIITSTFFFEGVCPFSKFSLRDNQLIALVEQNTIDELKKYLGNAESKEKLKKSAPEVKDMLEGKIKAPALFYISLK